ncbi:MAG: radical SAM protein [Treponema sp.]|jgi:MoaA/NifB/PqqE/SkfB family radical SAM enzyme|nr:radical SAM protein [Treponema sp.]
MCSVAGNIISNYLRGRLKTAEFAITNVCIAKCSFCDIWKQQPKVFADREKALAVIDRLADFGVVHITITGGEPLLHPGIVDFAGRAASRNMHSSVLNAAPQLLMRNDIVKRLDDAGCNMISISFDSGDPVIMAESRKIPNIMEDMARALEIVKKTRIVTMASVLIWNDNYDKLEEVCARAKNMGFDFVSLNYPTFSRSRVYPLGGDGVSLSREKVIQGLESAIALRKSGKYGIINSPASMRNIVNYLRDPASAAYPCLGGSRVFFVDWFFDVRPCMQLPNVLGSMFSIGEKDLDRAPCNDCNMSWYRDFSAMLQGVKSVPVWLDSLSGLGVIKKPAGAAGR